MSNIRPEDVYEIRGDFQDPAGGDQRGLATGLNLEKTAIGRPKVLYRGSVNTRITEPDVYANEDGLMVLMYCPRCGRTSRILSTKKRIEFTRGADGGRISIEAFRCTWDNCGLHVRIQNNQMIDVRYVGGRLEDIPI